MSSMMESRATNSSDPTASSKITSKAKRVLGDAEKKAAAQLAADRDTQRVLDPESKEDRTPLPLLKQQASKGIVKRGADRRTSQQEGGSVSQSRTSHSESNEGSVSKMESSQSSDHASTSTPDEDSTANYMDDSSDSHSTFERSSNTTSNYQNQKSHMSSDNQSGQDPYAAGKGDVPKSQVEKPREYTAEDRRKWLASEVTITLTETPTMHIFSRQDEVVSRENVEEAAAVKKKNERYLEFCESRKGGESGGRYAERGMTTLNDPRKSIHTEVHVRPTKNSGSLQVTTWKLQDEFNKLNEEEAEVDDGGQLNKEIEGELGGGDEGMEQHEDEGDEGGEGEGEGKGPSASSKKAQAWTTSSTLLETVLVVERAVVGNTFEDLQLSYRGLAMEPMKDIIAPVVSSSNSANTAATKRRNEYATMGSTNENDEVRKEDKEKIEKEPEEERGPQTRSKLKILWRYQSEITAGKNVSCLAWNRKNPDILASGYGEYGIPTVGADAYSGMVACWSLKNPVSPERVIQIEGDAGVSAMHFSNTHPSLLAVGNTDGTLALYDVRKHGNAPALKTTVSTGQHTGTIWEVRWVDRKERGIETLMSISADGHVMEWSIKKGLERTADLMKLKRMPNKSQESTGGFTNKSGQAREALLSRQSGGMCFDIQSESITYVVGTEDGNVHKCSKSQNENYVLDYAPHAEPVYRVRWSPFCTDYFLTCSADWTSRIYHVDKPEPIVKMDSNRQDAVHDVCWSPCNSTIYGAATAHGMVDIWDIADPMQPKTSLPLKDRSLNCLLFGEQESPVLTVGDNRGEITVIKLQGSEFEKNGMEPEEQRDRLVEKLEGS